MHGLNVHVYPYSRLQERSQTNIETNGWDMMQLRKPKNHWEIMYHFEHVNLKFAYLVVYFFPVLFSENENLKKGWIFCVGLCALDESMLSALFPQSAKGMTRGRTSVTCFHSFLWMLPQRMGKLFCEFGACQVLFSLVSVQSQLGKLLRLFNNLPSLLSFSVFFF